MRILYLHRTQGEEPESIHIVSIVKALRELGHQVELVGPAKVEVNGKHVFEPGLLGRIKRRLPRFLVEILQIGYNFAAYLMLRRAVASFRPDIIYERYGLYGFAGVLYARRHKVPLLLEVNTPYAQAWMEYYGLYLRRLARFIEKKTLLSADHIFTVSGAQRRMLVQEGIALERITVCHNAIDPDWFSPERHANPRLKAELGLSGMVVGFVGTMNRWQGVPEFAKVFPTVFRECPNVSFLFVGEGEFRAELEQFCREQGLTERVIFTGRKPHAQIPALVSVMDVTVLLNSNDFGSPMKIFEYWGMKKAVIAPRVAPVVEILTDGTTGLLIEPGNAAEMTEKIIMLATDPVLRKELGEAGRTYVTSHHTWRQNALAIVGASERLHRA